MYGYHLLGMVGMIRHYVQQLLSVKKKPKMGLALSDQVHKAYLKFCKKRGIPVMSQFGSIKQRKK